MSNDHVWLYKPSAWICPRCSTNNPLFWLATVSGGSPSGLVRDACAHCNWKVNPKVLTKRIGFEIEIMVENGDVLLGRLWDIVTATKNTLRDHEERIAQLEKEKEE